MELRTLRYYVATVDAGSVSGASELVHVTQPALSRQLRQLERELGVDLFVRRGGRLQLSAAGRQFLPLAQDIVSRSDNAMLAAAAFAAGKLERITIVAPTTTLTDVIAPFLATLGPEDPVPTVLEANAAQAYARLQSGADLAIVTESPRPPHAAVALATLPVWAYVRTDHPWRGRSVVSLAELAEETVIALTPNFKPRQILDGALAQAALSLNEVVPCSNAQVAQALAAAGRGVAVVSDDPRFGLHPLAITSEHGALRIRLFATWDEEHHATATLRELSVRLREFCIERYGNDVAPAADEAGLGQSSQEDA